LHSRHDRAKVENEREREKGWKREREREKGTDRQTGGKGEREIEGEATRSAGERKRLQLGVPRIERNESPGWVWGRKNVI